MNVRWEPFSGIQQRGGQLLRRRRLGRGHAEGCPEELLAGGAGSSLGTGGMLTKVTAAKRATEAGVDMIITNGAHAEVLYDIVEGKPVGTRFVGRKA